MHLAPICNAQSVLVGKISASELSRKFIKSALLVGLGWKRGQNGVESYTFF